MMNVSEIRQQIKDEGILYVIIGFNSRLEKMEATLEKMRIQVLKIQSELLHTQTTVYKEANKELQTMLRSTEGMNLITFETQDVYQVNKRIEQLQREIAEINSILRVKEWKR